MPFHIVRNDIVQMQVDAIVNSANPSPVVGSGTDAGIYAEAGDALLEARKAIGPIPRGSAAITPAFGLNARCIIHTVGPVWQGGLFSEEKTLRSCYLSSLDLALRHGCRSIAFPLISAGNYGYPQDKALGVAISAFSEFLSEHDMDIYLVVFDQKAFRLSRQLMENVRSYIDEHYVTQKTLQEYGSPSPAPLHREVERAQRFRRIPEPSEMPLFFPSRADSMDSDRAPKGSKALFQTRSLKDLVNATDAGFSETLLKLIDRSGKKDSEIYTKANVSRQHFSKIRNNPAYKPTKSTAIAFAIALELDKAQTEDLIGRAGYALTNSSKFDVIIMFFIENGNYNLHDINAALYEFDQSLLGA